MRSIEPVQGLQAGSTQVGREGMVVHTETQAMQWDSHAEKKLHQDWALISRLAKRILHAWFI